jgi:hypothetical protein
MPLHHEEVLATKDRVAQPSPWVTSFFLPHDSLGVGERRFGQVVIQLHRLTGPIYEHVIGTFNICSRGPTRRSLTDTSRGYNFGGADFPHKTLWPSQTMVSAFYLRAPPDLRLSIQSLPTELKREQILNLTSGSLHSIFTATYHLSIALLMVSHQEIGLTMAIRKVTHNASTLLYNTYQLNAQPAIT